MQRISKKLIKKIAERYGVGYREVPLGEGGCIDDYTKEVKKHIAEETAKNLLNTKYFKI